MNTSVPTTQHLT
jgi:hypothetical protein